MKLYLDIFTFQLQKKIRGKYTDEAVNFDEIYKILQQRHPNHSHIESLLQELVKSFDEKFYCDNDNTKALSFQGNDNCTFSSERNTISGIFIGGNTGLEYNVYKNDNATQVTHVVQQSEVASLPFFFKLWFPKKFQMGVIIIQRYSNQTCVSLFKQLVKDLFKELGYKVKYHKFIPKDARDEYIERCNISEIAISRKEDIDNALKPKLKLLKSSTIVSKIRNIAISTIKLVGENAYREQVLNDIVELYPPYDEKEYSLKFFYIDEKGDKASSTLEGLEQIVPSINLGAECFNQENTPDWNEIEKKANGYIELIKKDLGYIVKEQ